MKIGRPFLIMLFSCVVLALGDPNYVPSNPDAAGLKEDTVKERQELEEKAIEGRRYDVPTPPRDGGEEDKRKQEKEEKE